MAKKKTVTRKRRTTTRKKKATPPEDTTAADASLAEEVAGTEKPRAADQPDTAEAKKTASATKRRKTKRRSKARKKTVAAEPVAGDASERPAEAGDDGPAPPADGAKVKKTRKRRKSKARRAKTPPAAEQPAEVEVPVEAEPPSTAEVPSEVEPPQEQPAPPAVRPISPAAEVERSGDAIVIRFPSAANSDERPAAPPVADDESAAPAAEAPVAESRLTADEPAPSRSRRRRRRKKKDPRVAPVPEVPEDWRSDEEEQRFRPEPPDEQPSDAAEPASAEAAPAESVATEKPSRRRRRRSRRSKKQEEAVETASEQVDEDSEPTPPTGEKEMIINVVPHEECRIAIMERGKLQEIYLERASAENQVGNIYKGIVTNVEPSIQAAFVDFGQGKNGFLHVSDLHPQYFPNGEGNTESVGRKMPRRSRPPIQRCLRRGQQLLAQITKEGIGTKGPTLTTYLSIPGRFLVMMPGMRQLGVSRKIEDDDIRHKLRDQLHDLNLPEESGFIARTAALGRTKRELQSDLNYLSRLWKSVEKRIDTLKPPAEIYTESDLVTRTIRDVYTSDITRIVVDDEEVAERAHEFLSIFSPRSRDIVVHFDGPEPIFHRYGIEDELERLHSRHVPLKSGGSLVIDQTEALVAVDVNSGRFRAEDDAETTAYKIDLEAADEIPRQLRLRDLGGVVICDFIDVRQEKHKREIERRLNRNLKQHKERAKILRMSEFGIIEMTRQRQRASLTRNVYQDCRACRGRGLVKTAESVAFDVMRLIQLAVTKENIQSIEVAVSMEVGYLLQNRKRKALHDLETTHKRSIAIRAQPDFGLDQIQLKCCDHRGRVVPQP